MEKLRNAKVGKAGEPRENPPTSGIVQHDSDVRKYDAGMQGLKETRDPRGNPPTSGMARHDPHSRESGSDPVRNRVRFASRWVLASNREDLADAQGHVTATRQLQIKTSAMRGEAILSRDSEAMYRASCKPFEAARTDRYALWRQGTGVTTETPAFAWPSKFSCVRKNTHYLVDTWAYSRGTHHSQHESYLILTSGPPQGNQRGNGGPHRPQKESTDPPPGTIIMNCPLFKLSLVGRCNPGIGHTRGLPRLQDKRWESCRTMPLVGGFSRGSHVSPALSFQRSSILTSITLMGSQDLDTKSHPNLFTYSILSSEICLTARLESFIIQLPSYLSSDIGWDCAMALISFSVGLQPHVPRPPPPPPPQPRTLGLNPPLDTPASQQHLSDCAGFGRSSIIVRVCDGEMGFFFPFSPETTAAALAESLGQDRTGRLAWFFQHLRKRQSISWTELPLLRVHPPKLVHPPPFPLFFTTNYSSLFNSSRRLTPSPPLPDTKIPHDGFIGSCRLYSNNSVLRTFMDVPREYRPVVPLPHLDVKCFRNGAVRVGGGVRRAYT
ncbi:hypothetical protein PR048_027820 [Dryococelus australis]|uniref:Uncharacterized protein n=1 Tax=Dryococelus australis TaxID=614101 RepID=A0ABQ9GHJ3_9NEOP|nr:hypothetical protein PR048_027820 [Dryococelus australis]